MPLKAIDSVCVGIVLTSFIAASGLAQTPPAHPDSVPIYKVTVIGRTVQAVNYQYRSGPTRIDFLGTVLLPESKGDATVESKAGRTEIDAHFERLAPSQRFGNEYLAYVLWAVTPEGHARNLGEILVNGSEKGHTHVTTDLQVFGLLVTAEPYSQVRLPSDVVVLENRIRPDTIGGTEPIQARYELMPRGTYTYNVPASIHPEGPKVSMAEYEETLELYQAQNAVQIAQAQGADQYAPEVFEKARQQYENARRLQADHSNRNAAITAARDAAQTAEDARALAVTRKHDAELASARSDAEREQQLRIEAQNNAQRAQSEAAAAANALESERNARREAEAREAEARAAAVASPPAAVPERRVVVRNEPDQARVELRGRLLAQLKGRLEAIDTARGLVVTVRDSGFHGAALSPTTAANLAWVSSVVTSQPGLLVEVDGNSDMAGSAGERFSLDRATAVKDALIRAGLPAGRITARGFGNTHPFGPNTTGQGREDNRRVEIVIHGDPIGETPSWEKTYSLNISRQ